MSITASGESEREIVEGVVEVVKTNAGSMVLGFLLGALFLG